jgi:hypothetical protein
VRTGSDAGLATLSAVQLSHVATARIDERFVYIAVAVVVFAIAGLDA